MSDLQDRLSRFFEKWSEEFTRALEMFTGIKPTVISTTAQVEQAQTLDSPLWWKQVYQVQIENEESAPPLEQEFTVWVGVPAETWTKLAAAMAADAGQEREMFLEMLGQAHQGAAVALSAGSMQTLHCAQAEECEAPALGSLVLRQISIDLREGPLPPLLLAVAPSAARALALDRPAGKTIPQTPEAANGSEILDRLMEIDLPLSVALGRAVLPIRDILKMTPGTLVELDRHIGEYADILVHGKVVARGEVVSIKGNYGVRIKEIMSREDRLALQKRI
jgi:flagellar motor switch protein FliN